LNPPVQWELGTLTKSRRSSGSGLSTILPLAAACKSRSWQSVLKDVHNLLLSFTLAQHPSHPPPPPSLQYLSRVTRGGGLQPIKTTAKKHTWTLNLYMNVSFSNLRLYDLLYIVVLQCCTIVLFHCMVRMIF
jgi:hypothetical protein